MHVITTHSDLTSELPTFDFDFCCISYMYTSVLLCFNTNTSSNRTREHGHALSHFFQYQKHHQPQQTPLAYKMAYTAAKENGPDNDIQRFACIALHCKDIATGVRQSCIEALSHLRLTHHYYTGRLGSGCRRLRARCQTRKLQDRYTEGSQKGHRWRGRRKRGQKAQGEWRRGREEREACEEAKGYEEGQGCCSGGRGCGRGGRSR